MKCYIIKDEDIKRLYAEIDRNPQWGSEGGSSGTLTPQEKAAHDAAHRFYNYVLRRWVDSIKE